MDTKDRLAAVALAVIEADGVAGFSTRAVCDRARVSAPTLYHHFRDADDVISAAVSLGFEQFLARKKAQLRTPDPVTDVMSGWDDYVDFARERPRLYAAMSARTMEGRNIAAARASRGHLEAKLQRLAEARPLGLEVPELADLIWATAHGAALLCVTAAPRAPSREAIAALRDAALAALTRRPKTKRKAKKAS
jgi:AcrR family transcriptional regulator